MTQQLTVSSSQAPATRIVEAGSGGQLFQVVGPNTVYIGDDNGISWTDPTAVVPIGAGGYFSVDGQSDLYATVEPGQMALLYSLTGGGSFFSPTDLSGLGGVTIYVQATAPTGQLITNSLWFDTANNSELYWTGTQWENLLFAAPEVIEAGTIVSSLLADNLLITAPSLIDPLIVNEALPAANASGPTLFGNDGVLNYVSGADGNDYSVGILSVETISSQNFVTGPLVIGGGGGTPWSVPVSAGKYHIKGQVYWTQGPNQAVQQIGMSGPATSQCLFSVNWQQIANAAAGNWQEVPSLTNIPSPAFAAGVPVFFEFQGTVTFSAAGTFEMLALPNSSSNSFIINAGSYLEVTPITGVPGSGVPNALTKPVTWLLPTGDTTGALDTAAIQAILNSNYPVFLAPGSFYISFITMPWNGILDGCGPLTEVFSVAGSGDSILMSNPTAPSGSYAAYPIISGRIGSFYLDGTMTSGGANGLHIGNGLGFVVEGLAVRNFTSTGGTPAIGIWVDDDIWWTEKCTFRTQVAQCTICYQFSNEDPAHGSFEYSTYDMVAYWDTGQTAFNIVNTGSRQVFYGGGKYYWRGNCHDTSGAPGPFLAFTGDILFKRCWVEFCPESNAPAGEAQTILDNGGATGARFQNCNGWMDFGANAWAVTNMTEAVDFTGSIQGDATLQALRASVTKPVVTTPTVAASTTFTNNTGVGVNAIVSGGTGVSVTLNGNATGLSSGIFPIPVGQTINLGAYTVAPTVWHWIPAAYP